MGCDGTCAELADLKLYGRILVMRLASTHYKLVSRDEGNKLEHKLSQGC
jgi:hypothetical protein